jgi:HAD superfamily hydrolase (TIGR01509 family)
MFAAAIFDMDGLLIDSERVIMESWIAASRTLGIELQMADFATLIGSSGPDTTERLVAMVGGRDAFRAVRTQVAALFEQKAGPDLFPLKRGALPMLAHLRARQVPCAVASSSQLTAVEQRLAAVDVRHHFAAVAAGSEVPRSKPDPAVYLLAAQRLGVPAGQCLAFEDSAHGAHAALAAGMQVVMVPDLSQPPEMLVQRSLRVLTSLDDALPHLPDWFSRFTAR